MKNEQRTRFNLLFETLADSVMRKTGKTQKEIAAELGGLSRQLFWSGANERRSVGFETLTQLLEMASYPKSDRAEIMIAWLKDRVDSGALGAAMVVLFDAVEEYVPEVPRQRVLLKAVDAYTKQLETKRK